MLSIISDVFGHLYVFFEKIPIHVFCLFFDIKVYEQFIYFVY